MQRLTRGKVSGQAETTLANRLNLSVVRVENVEHQRAQAVAAEEAVMRAHDARLILSPSLHTRSVRLRGQPLALALIRMIVRLNR